jgi:hypothetical protein
MLHGLALVSMLVVPGDACHQLLRLGAPLLACLLLEVFCDIASQRGGQSSPMEDLDVAALPDTVSESEIMCCWRKLHIGISGTLPSFVVRTYAMQNTPSSNGILVNPVPPNG